MTKLSVEVVCAAVKWLMNVNNEWKGRARRESWRRAQR